MRTTYSFAVFYFYAPLSPSLRLLDGVELTLFSLVCLMCARSQFWGELKKKARACSSLVDLNQVARVQIDAQRWPSLDGCSTGTSLGDLIRLQPE